MRWQRRLRDLFFFALAMAILYDQVLIAQHAQTILIVLVIFLLGCIPALRGDSGGKPSVFARFVMKMLGYELPPEGSGWEDHGRDFSEPGPGPSDGPTSAPPERRSRESSK